MMNYDLINYYYVFIWLFIFVLLFWFRKYIRLNDPKMYLIWFLSVIWWIFSANLLLYLLEIINFDYSNIYYSAIFWPFVEEIFKFVIIIFIISVLRDNTKNPFRWLSVWILVWLGFGLYENYIYMKSWIDDIMVLIYRFIFVWGMILHPLTSGIAWYMFYISLKITDYMPKIFVWSKMRFRNIGSILSLVSHIYNNSWKSLITLFWFIKNVLFLDVTIKYLLVWLKKTKSWFWHWPVEIVYEWFFLAVWIHILYNSILTYMSVWDVFLAIVWILIVIILFRLFSAIYQSDFIGIVISIVIFAWFVLKNYSIWSWIMMFWLLLLMMNLIILALNVERRLNYL